MTAKTNTHSPRPARTAIVALVMASLLLSACNTIAGAGRDIESVGDSIEGAAEGAN